MKSGEELLKTKQSGKQGEQAFSLKKAKSFYFFFFPEKTFCKSSHGRYVCKFCMAGALCEHMGPLIMKY